MHTALIEKLKKELEGFDAQADIERVGEVVATGDGIAEIHGLSDAKMAEMIVFDTATGKDLKGAIASGDAVFGVVLNLEEEVVKAIILGDASQVSEGMRVKGTGSMLSIPVGDALKGRVVNPLGEALDGLGKIEAETQNPIEREAYGVIDRQSVSVPLHTGIKAIDSMIPIGRGQRELIIGDRFTGKTTVAIDTIINQLSEPKDKRPVCIYVSIGQKDSKVARIVAELKEKGAMDYTIIVHAGASAPAALQFLAPFAGAAIGEFFMDRGDDALIIYDDLSKQAVAYREISLLLRRPPGREAYPGDIFYLHSRLLERAARLSEEKGGGSLTALPIIETQENDVSAYIPTNVISITDGQIYLTSDLFNKGVRPAIDVGISVSRVGSSAQTKAMKKVAGKLRLELAQYYELEAFSQFASDLDADTKKRLDSGARMVEILKQGKGVPQSFERQVVVIFAATQGYFDSVEPGAIGKTTDSLMSFMDREHSGILSSIHEEKAISEEVEQNLRKALDSFKERHN